MKRKGVTNSPAPPAGGAYQPKSFKFEPDKFRELIVYIAKQSADDPVSARLS